MQPPTCGDHFLIFVDIFKIQTKVECPIEKVLCRQEEASVCHLSVNIGFAYSCGQAERNESGCWTETLVRGDTEEEVAEEDIEGGGQGDLYKCIGVICYLTGVGHCQACVHWVWDELDASQVWIRQRGCGGAWRDQCHHEYQDTQECPDVWWLITIRIKDLFQ